MRDQPTSPGLASDLSEFTAHQPTSEEFSSADKKTTGVRRSLKLVLPMDKWKTSEK